MSIEDITSADTGRKQLLRVGRGNGCRRGKTCGRGQKGLGSRSGGKRHLGPMHEGGQFPFWQRMPRRGFSNARFRVRYATVKLAQALERVEGDVLSIETIIDAGLAHTGELIKLVAGVAVSRPVTVRVHAVTASARQAIEAAGGTVAAVGGGANV